MSIIERTLITLIRESANPHTRHLERHLENFEPSEQYQVLKQLLCIRSPFPSLPASTLNDIDTILERQRGYRILTPAISIPSKATLSRSRSSRSDTNIRLWKGDITTLALDVTAITNAANSQMLGCFQPSHKCIDNVIHSWAGPRLRQECFNITSARGSDLAVGEAVVTKGYCLPSPYIIHTVGPQLERGSKPTTEEKQQLRQCYVSVLEQVEGLPANEDGRKIVALCCISTGLFAFPAEVAARIAVETVMAWFAQNEEATVTDVIFVTYTDADYETYSGLLKTPRGVWQSAPQHDDSKCVVQGDNLSLAREWLEEAEAVIVSAGAGLSASDGLDYASKSLFRDHFPGFLKYRLSCLYDVFGFTGWPSEQDRWGYYFTHLNMVRSWPTSEMYKSLIGWLSTFGEDAHVRTSNADGLFLANGWAEEKLSTPQGRYTVLQCMANCRPESTWPTQPWLDAAVPNLDLRTQRLNDARKVPKCQHCGGDMFICVRAADWFNDRPYRDGEARWKRFRRQVLDTRKRTVILELGVGMNTPGVLRWPNEDLLGRGEGRVRLIRVGLGPHAVVPFELEEEGLATCIDGDIKGALAQILPLRS